jgi:hypothetical protein
MSEHQIHTRFLWQCLLYDDSSERHQLEARIIRVQRDLCCVQRAAWLMALLTMLAVTCFGYGAVLVEDFPYTTQQSIINIIGALGVGSLISLLAFASLGIVYRWKLDQQREECRERVTRLLESRLGKPVVTNFQDHLAGGENGGHFRVASEAGGSPGKIESAIQR